VINVFKNDMAKCLKNEEIYNIIIALGCGYGKNIDISKIRYKKIIIMTDADVDGEHIAFLLILMFYKLFRPLIDAGYLYLAIPPLYRVSKGEKVGYFDNYDEIDAFARAGVKDKKQSRDDLLKSWTITRFKGLGEMDPEQLSETTMNPGSRKIVQITIPKDEEDSTKKLLALLGGDDSKFRKTFLMSYTDRADVVV
jgi:DNA gyrase subunit B